MAGRVPEVGGVSRELGLPVVTDRLTLRLHRWDDLDALLAYYADAAVARYLLHEPWSPKYAEEQLAKRLAHTGLDGPGTALALAIEQDGRVIGDVTLWTTDGTGKQAEIGWVLHPAHGGRGYASEAAHAVLTAAFDIYRLHRVVARLDARNTASARLCERLGMTKEAHLRQDWWSKGEWTDTAVYGLLAAEWTGRPPERGP